MSISKIIKFGAIFAVHKPAGPSSAKVVEMVKNELKSRYIAEKNAENASKIGKNDPNRPKSVEKWAITQENRLEMPENGLKMPENGPKSDVLGAEKLKKSVKVPKFKVGHGGFVPFFFFVFFLSK
jgi:tRNA U55 pseudouridine synthase TruB